MPPRARRPSPAAAQLAPEASPKARGAHATRRALVTFTAVELAIIAAGAAITASASNASQWQPVRAIAVLLVAALVAERFGRQRHRLFVAPPIGCVLALVLLGAAPALAIAAVTVAASALLTRRGGEALDRIAAIAVLVGVAAAISHSVLGATQLQGDHSPGGRVAFVALIFCACVASYALTALAANTRHTLRRGAPLLPIPVSDLATIARAVLLSSLLVAGVGLAYTAHDRTIALLTALVFGAGLSHSLGSEILRARRHAAELDSERVRHLSYPNEIRGVISARCSQALEEDVICELSGLRVRLDDALDSGDTRALRRAVKTGVEILGTEVEGIRQLIHELRPAVLDRHGLAAALEALAQRTATREGVNVTLTFEPSASTPQLPASEELAVYRLVEESVRNALEHANASHIAIIVRTEARATTISVLDDGRGFDLTNTAPRFGLNSMRERAHLIDARVAVRSRPGEGTEVEITLSGGATGHRKIRTCWTEGLARRRMRRAAMLIRYRGVQLGLIATAAIVSVLTSNDRAWEPLALFEALALAAVLGAGWEMRFERCRFTPVAVPVAAAAILLGPAPGFACALAAAISDAAQRRIGRKLTMARLASRSLTTLFASGASALLIGGGVRGITGPWDVLTSVGIFVATMALTVRVAMLYYSLTARRARNGVPVTPAAAPLAPVVAAESLIIGAALTGWLVHAPGIVVVLGLALVASQRMIGASATAQADARALAAARRSRLLHGIAEQEAECARWARELHDDTIQGLAIVRSQLAGDTPTIETAQLRVDATLMLVEVDAALRGLAGLVDELRPALPATIGLLPSLRLLAERIAPRDRLTVDLDVRGEDDWGLEPDQALSLYRITQEALTNAARHGRASHAVVTIRDTDEELWVTVVDNGNGFDPAITPSGFGLAAMRERAELLGGTLMLSSRLSKGTTVEVRVPSPRARATPEPVRDPSPLRPTLRAMQTPSPTPLHPASANAGERA